jgi:hypothetical protein
MRCYGGSKGDRAIYLSVRVLSVRVREAIIRIVTQK